MAKKYRRLEITAFRHRVTIVSGAADANFDEEQNDTGVRLRDVDSSKTIEPESNEGQEILIEAIRLLKEKISE